MDIQKKLEDRKLEITVTGRLNADTAPMLDKIVRNELSEIDELVFCLSGLEYTSSAGMRVFLKAWQIMDEKGGTVAIEGVSETVMEIFRVSGFDRFLTIRR